jgi:hypothetical protein
MAGITWWNFYFRLYAGSIRSAQVVDFLGRLMRHLSSPLLIVWDRLASHRSCLVRDFVVAQGGWIHLEYLWGYWKQHELANVCPKNYWDLSEGARRTLRRMRRRPRLIQAFWKQAELSF